MNVVVTGSEGFLGKNLCAALAKRPDTHVTGLSRKNDESEWRKALADADVVFHAAGVNRPEKPEDYAAGNVGPAETICAILTETGRKPLVVFTSSVQVLQDNPYGRSKLAAEEVFRKFSEKTGARVVIHRLKNLFGKWSRPNYNTVVATFCHNIARDLPIAVRDPSYAVDLSYIDDVTARLLADMDADRNGGCTIAEPVASHHISLGDLAATIRSFKAQRETLLLPELADAFQRDLYATYLSFLPTDAFAYNLQKRTDNRGSLAEFVKTGDAGQIFVSRTKPGITRGNHFHHTKVEKFLVVEGTGVVRFRSLEPGASPAVIEYPVSGEDYRVVDIPPGYTHSIENTGAGVMVTLFWASEVFDPQKADTYAEPVHIPTQPAQ